MKKQENIRIVVTGSKGQLGTEIQSFTNEYQDFDFTFIDIDDLDLTNEAAVRSYFAPRQFDVIINCSAYTAVDLAEENQRLAFQVNSDAVKVLAGIAKDKQIRLIHISTDYVFEGNATEPVTEDSPTAPLSVYGQSKLEGEKSILSILNNAYIIRTAWLYSPHGKNFVKTILRLAAERNEISVVADQIGSPTSARDLASAILMIIDNIFSKGIDNPGIYHYSNEGVISWYEFADAIVKYCNLPCTVKAITTEEFKTKAIRPKYSVLSKKKIRENFGIEPPHWHASLVQCLEKLKVEKSATAA